QGEARASFGDDRVLVERYLTRPRHIEMQVFADRHGNVLHLFERDCSIQRRHQKVVEEAPAPGLMPERRAAMGKAACDAAAAIGYEGAGTVEFIAEGDAFFFMEMNTRLQVEHPVTEMVTGQDLVEWQLRVAAGGRLPLLQDELRIDGHAIEVRIYAEDPARDYRPSTGALIHLRQPAEGRHVRVDTGVRQGDAITVHYDPMLAKLIVWDRDRPAAVARLGAALAGYEVAGVRTNLRLLAAIAADPAFAAAELDTGFLDRRTVLPAAETVEPAPAVLAAAAATVLARRGREAREMAAANADPFSPWAEASAWRLNGEGYQDFLLRSGDGEYALRAIPRADRSFAMRVGAATFEIARDGEALSVDGVRHRVPVAENGDELTVLIEGANWEITVIDPLAPPQETGAGDDRLVAPMPGRIVSLHTQPGAVVAKGDVLLVLEAMKVQMRLAAPRNGTIAAVRAREGELVEDGVELVTFVSAE
ncbi:MAG: 3-methylcrotonyl-CoA carboxylase, partial [Acetobacteraceae bacterium]|nr:3-methylcrotonyl-CoA carboxylase [Acetobacteraceae bacterium]